MDVSPTYYENKLRLMISYGGQILPRPHDKSLFYAGGETRLIAVNRTTAASFVSLTSQLTKSLPFNHHTSPYTLTVKYQLPNHDLDSLISISTDEDLANMLDEYDRLAADPTPCRIRFFIFGVGDENRKTEEWFVDALRSAGVRGGGAGGCGGGAGGGGGSGTSLPESVEAEKEREDSSFGSNSDNSYSAAVRVCSGGDGGANLHEVKVVLPSVDSLGSDGSIPSPNFSQQAIVYQDASESKPVSANLVEKESNISDRSHQSDTLSPVQVSGYVLSKPTDHPSQVLSPPPPQQQYIHHPAPQTHYVNQYFPSAYPVASYPTMYQPCVQTQQPVQYHQINKPYPMYMMPVGQAQNPYAIPQTVSHGQPQVNSNPVMVPSHMLYEGYKHAAPASEYAPKMYMAAQPVSGATDDHHHQVVAFPPKTPPSQPVAVVSPMETTNYNCEYEDPMHAQIYKSQPPGPTLPTMAETVMLSENLTQLQVENAKQ